MTLRELIDFYAEKLADAEAEAEIGVPWDPIRKTYEQDAATYRETIEQLARLEDLER